MYAVNFVTTVPLTARANDDCWKKMRSLTKFIEVLFYKFLLMAKLGLIVHDIMLLSLGWIKELAGYFVKKDY